MRARYPEVAPIIFFQRTSQAQRILKLILTVPLLIYRQLLFIYKQYLLIVTPNLSKY